MTQVINTLTVHGEDRLVDPLREKFKTSNPFNTLIPQIEGLPFDPTYDNQEYESRLNRYGWACGMDWRFSKWGFLHEPTDLSFIEDKTTSFAVRFTTIDNSARVFVRNLIRVVHADLGFKLHFSCEKQGYEGAFHFRQGRTRRDRTWRFGGDPDTDRY